MTKTYIYNIKIKNYFFYYIKIKLTYLLWYINQLSNFLTDVTSAGALVWGKGLKTLTSKC